MMDDILKQIKAGEVSGVQFKERILDKYDIACELVAFSNSHGGKLVVGIKDKTGETNATFMNNDKAQEFVIMVWREESNQVGTQVEWKSNQVEEKSDQVGNEVHGKSNQVEAESNQVGNEVCGKSNQVEVESNQVSNDVCGKSNQVEDYNTKKVTLTNKQKDIINFCSVPRTSLEIMERLGVSNQTKNRERYITSLVAAGYLQMTNPDNPTASNQKYKKVNIR